MTCLQERKKREGESRPLSVSRVVGLEAAEAREGGESQWCGLRLKCNK
jgi:hypothetical protein